MVPGGDIIATTNARGSGVNETAGAVRAPASGGTMICEGDGKDEQMPPWSLGVAKSVSTCVTGGLWSLI